MPVRPVEGVLRRLTKRILYPTLYYSKIEGGEYEDRLKDLNFVSFEMRRFQKDLIFAHKIYLNISDLRFKDFFVSSKKRTRGPAHKLISVKCKTDQYCYSFFHRIVAAWNSIPSNVVLSSHNEFKTFVKTNPLLFEKYLPSVVRRLRKTM